MEGAFFSTESKAESLSVRRHVDLTSIHLIDHDVQRSPCNVTASSTVTAELCSHTAFIVLTYKAHFVTHLSRIDLGANVGNSLSTP